MVVKEPGAEFALTCADTELPLASVADADPLPPYVRLIHDVLVGDRSLFTRPDGLGSAWDAITPLLENRPPVVPYATGQLGSRRGDRAGGPGRVADRLTRRVSRSGTGRPVRTCR